LLQMLTCSTTSASDSTFRARLKIPEHKSIHLSINSTLFSCAHLLRHISTRQHL
jgi:hypothetical protein